MDGISVFDSAIKINRAFKRHVYLSLSTIERMRKCQGGGMIIENAYEYP